MTGIVKATSAHKKYGYKNCIVSAKIGLLLTIVKEYTFYFLICC